MHQPMKLRLARVVLSVCLAASTLIPMSAYAAAMRGIRTGVTPERTRVVFDLDGVVSYEIFSLRAPDRIVIDFTSARVDPALSYHLVGSDVLQRVRYAARGAEGLRVVLDVSRPVSAKDLSLGPAGGYGHRVVVDLSPAAPASLAPAAPATSTGTLVVPSAGGINESETAPRMADTTSGVDGSMQTAPHTAMVPVAVDAPTPMPTASTAPVDDRSSYIGLAAGDAIRDVSLDVSGSIGIESRYFFQSPRFASQPRATGSMSFKPELYWLWDEDRQSLLFVPFARVDQNDDRRTHWDIRELGYIYAADNWELRAGIRKVFWGVAESNHLVDIINQTDLVENIDLEDKLGQPMVNLALVRDWGTLDFFVLPGFRERTFPGRDGRFQGPLRILGTDAEFESAAENSHIDYALRYWNYFGVFDIGLYHFWGTTREPRFGFKVTPSGEPVLFPIYDLIHQTGADVQATIDNWLLNVLL